METTYSCGHKNPDGKVEALDGIPVLCPECLSKNSVRDMFTEVVAQRDALASKCATLERSIKESHEHRIRDVGEMANKLNAEIVKVAALDRALVNAQQSRDEAREHAEGLERVALEQLDAMTDEQVIRLTPISHLRPGAQSPEGPQARDRTGPEYTRIAAALDAKLAALGQTNTPESFPSKAFVAAVIAMMPEWFSDDAATADAFNALTKALRDAGAAAGMPVTPGVTNVKPGTCLGGYTCPRGEALRLELEKCEHTAGCTFDMKYDAGYSPPGVCSACDALTEWANGPATPETIEHRKTVDIGKMLDALDAMNPPPSTAGSALLDAYDVACAERRLCSTGPAVNYCYQHRKPIALCRQAPLAARAAVLAALTGGDK